MPSPSRTRSASPSAPQAPKLGGGTVKLEPAAFGARFNMAVVHETVRAELSARRRGTASTKTRGEVSGGGAKPWRQKGTGRARAGSSRSPVWTGGGTVFGPQPRRYTFKINRKERQAALRSALSVHAQRDSLAVFDAGTFDAPSTSQAAGLLTDWGGGTPTLVLMTSEEASAGKSFRNLSRVVALSVEEAGVADVIGAASLLVSEAALPALVARAVGRTRQPATEASAEPAAAKPKAGPAKRKAAAAPAAEAVEKTEAVEAPEAVEKTEAVEAPAEEAPAPQGQGSEADQETEA